MELRGSGDIEAAQEYRPWPSQIPVLLAAHILLLLLATWFCSNSFQTSRWARIVVGIIPAQACLTGVWMGVGRSGALSKCSVGVFNVLVLAACLGFMQWSAFGGPISLHIYILLYLGLMAVPIAVSAVLLLVVRKWKNAVLVLTVRENPHEAEAFQFGVRHLLFVTFVVAVLLGLRTAVPYFLLESQKVVGPLLGFLLIGVAWGAPCVAIVWATLGAKRPQERVAVAMALALLVALLLPFYMGEDWRGQDFWTSVVMILAMFVIVAVSLLVVRAAGYRLERDVK